MSVETSTIHIDDVAEWLNLNQRTPVINSMLQRSLDAVKANVDGRLGSWTPVPWPDNVETAVVMQAARVYKRRNSPEGVTGFGDLGVVRVTLLDPDVVDLLGPYLAFHFGGALSDTGIPGLPPVAQPTGYGLGAYGFGPYGL